MMNTIEFLEQIIPIRDNTLKKLLIDVCRIDLFQQGQSINAVGEKDVYVRFLIEGAVRGYIINPHGEEITVDFALEPGSLIAGSCMLDESASEIALEALLDSRLFSIPVDTIYELRTKYYEIADLQEFMLAVAALHHWELRKMLYLKTAQERYEWFMGKYPGLIDKIKHKYIASFLNISPVTLSRIRHGKQWDI